MNLPQMLKKTKKIELGGGKNPKKGYINFDHSFDGSDICIDLEKSELPINDNIIEKIYSNHFFEHLGDIINLMNECWRVLKWGGKMEIIVPHKDCIVAWQDPTHKRYYNTQSMKYFCGEYLKKYSLDYEIESCFKQESVKVTTPDPKIIKGETLPYYKELKFVLLKDKKYYKRVNYPRRL